MFYLKEIQSRLLFLFFFQLFVIITLFIYKKQLLCFLLGFIFESDDDIQYSSDLQWFNNLKHLTNFINILEPFTMLFFATYGIANTIYILRQIKEFVFLSRLSKKSKTTHTLLTYKNVSILILANFCWIGYWYPFIWQWTESFAETSLNTLDSEIFSSSNTLEQSALDFLWLLGIYNIAIFFVLNLANFETVVNVFLTRNLCKSLFCFSLLFNNYILFLILLNCVIVAELVTLLAIVQTKLKTYYYIRKDSNLR